MYEDMESPLPLANVEADLLVVRGRVDQLESSYSEILALLKQDPRVKTPATTTTTLDPPPSSVGVQSQSPELVSVAAVPSVSSSAAALENLPLEEFETLVKCYRRMSEAHFPYVLIPEGCHALSLYRERPMLARAIVIITSWRNPERQSALRTSFLKDLGERYFIKCERSLDLLQAVLVYFGWYEGL